jgi:hypothetical protein
MVIINVLDENINTLFNTKKSALYQHSQYSVLPISQENGGERVGVDN